VGVRALVDGAWGFAATSDLTPDGVAGAARRAVAQARANRAAQVRPVQLAPVTPTPNGEWRSPIEVDPFAVPVADKVALLLAANEAAMKVPGVRFVNSSMSFLREEKTFASTDGTVTAQTLYRASPAMTVTAVSQDMRDFQTRDSADVAPMGLGYEHVTRSDLVAHAHALGQRRRAEALGQAGGGGALRPRACTPRTSSSRSTRASRTPRSWTARSASRPTTRAPAS
jgi:TldD protein